MPYWDTTKESALGLAETEGEGGGAVVAARLRLHSLLACLRLHPLFPPRHRSVPPGGIRPTTKNPTGVRPGAEISERKNQIPLTEETSQT